MLELEQLKQATQNLENLISFFYRENIEIRITDYEITETTISFDLVIDNTDRFILSYIPIGLHFNTVLKSELLEYIEEELEDEPKNKKYLRLKKIIKQL